MKEKTYYYTYVTEFYLDDGRKACLKIGYTNDLDRRMNEHLKNYSADDYVFELTYGWEDPDLALIMESWVRRYFKQKRGSIFIANDRFRHVKVSQEDIKELDAIADEVYEMGKRH